ncbi:MULTISPECIES: hypothetical protein [unclassified Streptomyces]|uniref:hypothetical protein n=1 Tax=unclassified Streptomyces TaxID=2593676 RepID=UPI0037F2A62C
MNDLHRERVVDGARLADRRAVHHAIVPTAPLSAAEVRERAGRDRLDAAYLGDVVVGCWTVRPPDTESPAAARDRPDAARFPAAGNRDGAVRAGAGARPDAGR